MKRVKAITVSCLLALFIIPLCATAQQIMAPPVIEWQKCLGGSKVDQANSVIRTLDNGYLVIGKSFSNDGNVTGHHGSTDSSDAWVVKLDHDGNIQWQRSLGGTNHDEFNHGLQASNGDFICIGTTQSNNGDISGLHVSADVWICRLTNTGTLLWSKVYGGTDPDRGRVIRKAIDGGYIVGADAESGDGDVTNHIGWSDIWILKINEAGVIQWQKKYGDYNHQFTNDLTVTSDGKYAIAGYTQWKGVPNCIGSPMYAFYSSLTLKIDVNGNVAWQNIGTNNCGNPGSSWYTASLLQMPGGQLFYVGHTINATLENYARWELARLEGSTGQRRSLTPRLNIGGPFIPDYVQTALNGGTFPNAAVVLPDSTVISTATQGVSGARNGTLTRWNTKDTLNEIRPFYQKTYGGTNNEEFRSIEVINEAEYIATGITNSNNGDVSGNHGDYDFWVVKFSSLNKIKGTVFIDNNNNGVKDPTESYFSRTRVQSVKGSKTISSVTNNAGEFLNLVDTGTFVTTVQLVKQYYTINPASKNTTFNSYNNTDAFNFALVPIPGKNDLRITATTLTPVRPGFNVDYRIDYVNEGTEPITNVVVNLLKPWNMAFISATPPYTSVSADTLKWNIGTLAPLASGSINVRLKADPPPNLNNGENVNVIVFVQPIAGDETPGDNRDTATRVTTGSIDPNDKNENGGGKMYTNQVAGGKALTYTIRFQNTGTDTAFTVVIRDTLETKLDWNSIEMVSASHNNQFSIKDGKYLTWTFENILLPDHNVNEPASHGYVTYQIKPKSTVVVGDVIANSASIYFDFNPPVKTNTHLTEIKIPAAIPPPSPNVSGVQNVYCSNLGVQKGKILNLPAASSGITVSVTFNGNALAVAADSTFSFDVSAMAPAVYVLQVAFTNSAGGDTLRRNVTIEQAVTPDVNVSANITNAVNLVDPVIITAANAAGGGSTPLYTFAKDRNITNVLQAESGNNVLSINPTTLTAGDNWIYVRMKTSATCYNSQFNVDSIKITMTLPVPPQPVINGMQTSYCSTSGIQKGKLGNYPVANTGATVTVKLDGATIALAADSSFSFNPTALPWGEHSIEVTFANPSGTKTSVAVFTVNGPVTPDVNVGTSRNMLSNAGEQATITATNFSGGGNAPLYTFAKDRGFTHVLQPESATSTYNIGWSQLSLGDNWFYVKMKTSSTCYSQQTAIDSVLIVKSASSGLTDPDFPNVRINTTPNPFRSKLTIVGLSTTKTYTVTIHNMQGTQVMKTRFGFRNSASIYVPGYMAGTYLISIYDETKKRMIGTIEVVKQ